jgi:acetyl-CoA carboxylase biotin carboxyl carrier protein
MFNLNEIKELIEIVDKSSIEQLEIENEGTRIYISKPKPNVAVSVPQIAPYPPQQPMQAPAQHVPANAQSAADSLSGSQGESADSSEDADKSGLHTITSPMVGTFYAAPSPGAEPFVKVGDRVKEDTVVCIVEAMKLMNEIEAEVSGVIVDVLVENAQLVEFGQHLFLVKPD